MVFVLTHRSTTNKNVTFQALHGTADCHDYRVDLHCDLTCWSQDKNLRDEDKEEL